MTAERPLTLDVTDFGPIARARVELRPLTVFVGPSNTGKSWLATLVYALHRHFGSPPWAWQPRFPMWLKAPTLPDRASTDLVRIAEQLGASSSRLRELPESIPLTPPVEAAIRSLLESQGETLGKEIQRCFGVEAGSDLVRQTRNRAQILLRNAVEGVSEPAAHELTVGDGGWNFLSTIPQGFRIRVDVDRYPSLLPYWWTNAPLAGPEPVEAWRVIGLLARGVLPIRNRTFYLPADRTGLMNAHRTVVSALIQSATMAGIRPADPVPPLSGVRGDFLEQLVEMVSDRERRQRGPRDREDLRRLGRRIEEKILSGAVKVGGLPGVAYPHFTYRPSGWSADLPLTNASSMVSELAPVVLYLRHLVKTGDLLIIDEPESHLHPAMQVAFTRQIAAVVKAGVRVIVTTHSEWVLEELGNVVGRSRLTEGGNGDSGSGSLAADDVGVWLFEPAGSRPSEDAGGSEVREAGGSEVREIALDAETGLYPSGFAAVAATLHNDWADIAGTRGDTE